MKRGIVCGLTLLLLVPNGVYALENNNVTLENETLIDQDLTFEDEKDGVMGQGVRTTSAYSLARGITQKWSGSGLNKVMYDGTGKQFGYGTCRKVVDVSSYNGSVNWQAAKNSGIDGAILRIVSHSGGMHEDNQFNNNASGCKNVGMPFGVYIYSYAKNTSEAANEANKVVSILKQRGIRPSDMSYPVYYDLEGGVKASGEKTTEGLSVSQNEANINTFISILNSNGYEAKVYSYVNYIKEHLTSPGILKNLSWVAAYRSSLGWDNPYYKGLFGWQYTSGEYVTYTTGNSNYIDVSCFSNYYGFDSDNHTNQPLGKNDDAPYLEYRANCQNVGWLSYFKEPNTAGTTGRSCALYQLQMKMNNVASNANLSGTIINSSGTLSYDSITSSTVLGESDKPMRQVKFQLTNVPGYQLEYRVHSADIGWQEWVKAGNFAGNSSKDIQAIDFRLIKSGTPQLSYQTHVQNIGWQANVSDGDTSGTSGKSLRLEGIKISLNNNESYTGTIQYRTHVQNIGWQNWVSNGQMSGTSGKSLRLEAIQIQLTEELAQHYDIYYRVHAQNFGWLDWAKNGQSAGSAGYSYRLEAIQIKLVDKNGSAPGSTARPYVQRYIGYQTHVQNVGWQTKSYDGDIAGTSGRSLRLEGIQISLDNPLYTGNVEYRTHIQNIGWEGSWKRNGQMSGTSGRSLRLEAIQIQLTGEMSNHYDIYYHVHAQDFGWLGWAKNGESAGTEGLSKRLEAIQIVLVQKGGSAPGSTARAFVKK